MVYSEKFGNFAAPFVSLLDMKEISINLNIRVCSLEELTYEDRTLVEQAKAATSGSYAPYSNFHVGAALRLANSEVVTGSNQENASYPIGCCAERTALFHAGHTYPGVGITTIAIAARRGEEWLAQPASPCGMCRQALMEVEHQYGNIRVMLYGTDGVYCINSVADLLPLVFTNDDL